MESFDDILKEMSEIRQNNKIKYENSIQYKVKSIEIDFKCWCFAHNKFKDINEQDFKTYKELNNVKIDFYTELEIYTKWFGYKFGYNNHTNKWNILEKGKLCI